MKTPEQRDLFPGALEMMILQTLKRMPMHGYALAQTIKGASDDLLQIEEGSLYPALQRMPRAGWVSADWNIIRLLQGEVFAIDRDQSISGVKTLDTIIDETEGQRRAITILVSGFAGIAVLLAMVGLYGLLSYSVVQRTKELGIRQSLGAQRRDIVWLVVREGAWLTVRGLAAGTAGAFA